MRPLLLSLAPFVLVLGSVWAQTSNDSGNMPQLPVGQTFKQVEFPFYQDRVLKFKGSAKEATGITLNRAETTDLKIEIYDNDVVTTTVTSPKADLYVNEQKLRTKDTVEIDRADMVATSQNCDFDLKTKKYLLRTNVKVILKHVDFGSGTTNTTAKTPHPTVIPTPAPSAPHPVRNGDSILESPGSYADTNSAPIAPSPDSK